MEKSIKDETLVHKNIIKAYTILVGGKEIRLEKWWSESMNGDYDNDYKVENEEQVKELFTEEEWEEVEEFISELK